MKAFDPTQNYEKSRQKIGYVNRKEATQKDYDRIGYKSGLEVHQQLLTEKKLFCRCPAGRYQKADEYDAEIIRHMRPTLSEMGEYDGTALMEFRTRKEIVYHIANPTACTYEVDDTPPFFIDNQALEIAIEAALASKMSIVGEVHITRKQYLDGSIPTGFQRTAIIGIEGELPLKHKTVKLIQMSLEEDACREVSDIGHRRVYRTDRLGMPLIETVTYPELMNPEELREACNAIRFLNRSLGKVRTGIGAGREDVNVSCTGGTRIEIKGVAHTKWIPELAHNECYRQWALLAIRDELNRRCKKDEWKMQSMKLNPKDLKFYFTPIQEAIARGEQLYAVNMPHFAGLLSHFTQPGKPFYDEFAGRLKVIACIERPNMATSEDLDDVVSDSVFAKVAKMFNAADDDAQIIFWAPDADVAMALDVIEERALMTFDGVPQETRKGLPDGTTIFERVLPGADRMYPDTDSAPIPLDNARIEEIRKNVPAMDVPARYQQLQQWGVPEDCYFYLFTHNLFPLIQRIVNELKIDGKYVGTFMGQRFKHLHGKYRQVPFAFDRVYDMFAFLQKEKIDFAVVNALVEKMFAEPEAEFSALLPASCNCKTLAMVKELASCLATFKPNRKRTNDNDKFNYLMGQMRRRCEGAAPIAELTKVVKTTLHVK
ncbi:MAG: Glu-tRNA(Gln) amidotransferase subunit GatE [Bacteroidales bacterium]|nr:Glu-tRNA(Gln) amidotransferase subunit GatE [Bacteroidales bacterium]MCR5114621.1 Glu-tRNA(Gln) amidotransferase subunit GatE [Bacteroidales bacterium]